MIHIELDFARPLLLLLAIPALAVILVPYLRLPEHRRRTAKKLVPVILHSVTVFLLVLIIAGLTFVNHTEEQSVMILIDVSDSTESVRDTLLANAQEIADRIDAETPVGVIAFGENALYTVTLGDDDRTIELSENMTGTDVTNLEAALEYAAMMMPSDRAKRIVLLSDGRENEGSAEDTAYYLAARGVRIDSMYFDTTVRTTAEMQISSFRTTDGAYVGESVGIHAVIGSNITSAAGLMLYDNDELAGAQEVTVVPGSNVFELTAVPETAGAHEYRLVLRMPDGADTLEINNESYAYLNAAGEASVLILADTVVNASALKDLLSAENTVAVLSSRNAPRTIVELCDYDEVILMNVDLRDLPNGYDTLLETYVSVYGRSLLAVGGNDTFMYGNMTGTALETMLPVTFTLNAEAGQSTALMLVLDCSNSMSMTSTYLAVAKQGAIQTVGAMNSSDSVGVISFNSTATLRSGLIPATDRNKESLIRTISSLTTSRGTYYTEALELAHEELSKSDAEIKHVIFLSDGNPSDYGYEEAVEAMLGDGITVSTIGLGYSSGILSDLAESGGGRYYYVGNASDLPDIMLGETEQITVSSLITGEFPVVTARRSELTDGLDGTLPALYGYLGTTIREDADACLTTEEGHPIYAVWDYGEGTAACFTGDLSGNWSSGWYESTAGKTVIAKMVETTVPDVRRDSSLLTDVTVRGKTADVTVRTSLWSGTGNTVTVTAGSGAGSSTCTLTQTAEGVYEGSVPAENPGVCELMVVETAPDGQLVDYLRTAFAVSYSPEYDVFSESGETLLRNVCGFSGGGLAESAEELASVRVSAIARIYDPLVPIAAVSAVLLLADIAVRKLRRKDLQEYLLRLRRR